MGKLSEQLSKVTIVSAVGAETNSSTLWMWSRSSHMCCVDKWAWLCADEMSFLDLKLEFHVIFLCPK